MNIDTFWELIDPGKNSEEPEIEIAKVLKTLEASEIEAYQAHFDQLKANAYQWDLWGAAYMIGGGCSDDSFIDFRYGLIAKGRQVYEQALQNPDSLAELGPDVEIENESFGYVALEVYEAKTGSEMPRKSVSGSADPLGEEWDFEDKDENIKRIPKLTEMYWPD